MFCNSCGKEISDNAAVCINCGVATTNLTLNQKIDNPSNLAGVASCCFPIVGLILYFMWKDEKPKSAKLVCNWMIGGIIAWIVVYVLFFIIGLASSI